MIPKKQLRGPLLPTILASEIAEKQTTLFLKIPENLAYFQGHFKDIPIVPGLVQMHWVLQYTNEFLGFNAKIKKGVQIKFMSPMKPLDTLFLHLEWVPEKSQIIYNYQCDKTKYSFGKLTYEI